MSYKPFFGMIATSTIIMFGLMYATTYRLSHVWLSQTRLWMAVFMGAMMAIVMLAWMLRMYENKRANAAIFTGSALLFALGLFLARSQATVGDVAWMKAMIPHPSIAILTSERANISDPRVRRLADAIILAQRREIAEMEGVIGDIEGSDIESADLPPTIPPMEGGSADETGSVPGAPSLSVRADALVGDVLVVDEVRVVSDAWGVGHPTTENGDSEDARVVGRAFVQHGTTERVPIAFDGLADLASGTALVAMFHDDTGRIGTFEFTGRGLEDAPLLQNAQPVTTTIVRP